MKMLTVFLLVFAIKTQQLTASTPAWTVHFTINNAGFDVDGTMKIVHAEIRFDPQNLDKSYMKVIADPSSVQTGITIRDKHLQRSDYFDVKHYPEILIESRAFRKTGRHHYTGTFRVTIKSVVTDISIPFTVKHEGENVQYDGNFTLNRLDFEIGDESLTLSNTVEINVKGKTTFP